MGTCVHTNHISASKWIAATSVFAELIFASLMVNNLCGWRGLLLRVLAIVNNFHYISVMFHYTIVAKCLTSFLIKDKIRSKRMSRLFSCDKRVKKPTCSGSVAVLENTIRNRTVSPIHIHLKWFLVSCSQSIHRKSKCMICGARCRQTEIHLSFIQYVCGARSDTLTVSCILSHILHLTPKIWLNFYQLNCAVLQRLIFWQERVGMISH